MHREYPSWPQHRLDQKVQSHECSVTLGMVLSSWGFQTSWEAPSAPFRIRAFHKDCVNAPLQQHNSLSQLGSSAAWGSRYGVNCCYRMQWLTFTWLSSNRGCEPNVSHWTPASKSLWPAQRRLCEHAVWDLGRVEHVVVCQVSESNTSLWGQQ